MKPDGTLFEKKTAVLFLVLFSVLFTTLYSIHVNTPLSIVAGEPSYEGYGDAGEYSRISLESNTASPQFRYRILPAVFVGFLPFPSGVSWFMVNYACLAAATVLLFLMCRRLGFSETGAFLSCLLFASSSSMVGYSLPSTDAFYFLCLTAALYAILTGRDEWLYLILPVGALNRLTILAVIPFYLMHRRRLWKTLALTAVSLAPALIVSRILYQPGRMFDWLGVVDVVADKPLYLLFLVLYPYGFVLLLAYLGWRGEKNRFLKDSWILVVLMASQALFGISVERFLYHASPVVFPLAVRRLVGCLRR